MWGQVRGSGEVLGEMWESMLECDGRWGVCENVLGEVWESMLEYGEV